MNLSNIVLMFPGQGSQSVGMGRDLAENFVEYRDTLNEASDTLGFDVAQLCFEDKQNQLGLTEYTQPALLATSVAAYRTLAKRTGLRGVAAVAGHSLGEYSALVCADALSFADALKAVRFRGQAMQRAVPVGVGAMAAYVGSQGDKVVALCHELSSQNASVEPVNFNSRSQIVLSGHKAAVEAAVARIAAEKLGRGIPLPVSAPFHSSLMQPAAAEMEQYLDSVELKTLTLPLYANVDAQKYTSSTYTRAHLVRQISSAVLWTQTLESIHNNESPALWLEVGSGIVLQGLVKKTIDNASCSGTQDLASLTSALTTLGA
jgi:[acyl-carrier-protein] S-malonyltransferase